MIGGVRQDAHAAWSAPLEVGAEQDDGEWWESHVEWLGIDPDDAI